MRYPGLLAGLTLLCSCLAGPIVPAGATTALLFDAQTGQVLHAENAYKPWYPASLTKLMTAYVAFDVLRTTELTEKRVLRLSEHANAQEPTKLWLRTGTELPLSTAIGAMVVKSANDAAVMVAEGVGGQLARFTRFGSCLGQGAGQNAASMLAAEPLLHPMDVFAARPSGLGAARYDDATAPWVRCRYDAFIARMNRTAQRLGMTGTTFVNANGLPDGRQVTNARDLALLAQALIRDFPQYAPVFAARSMRYSRGRLRSYNALLRTFEGADGMKTGFICASGYNIVASATRDNRRLVAVVLGWSRASDRNAWATALLNFGFGVTPTRFGPHDVLVEKVPSSGNEMVPPEDIRASLHSRSCRRGPGRRIRYRARDVAVRTLEAPMRRNGRVGAKEDLGRPVVANAPAASKRSNSAKVSGPVPKRVKRKRVVRGKTRKSGSKKKKKGKATGFGFSAQTAIKAAANR